MSLLRKLGSIAARAAPIASIFNPAIGGALGMVGAITAKRPEAPAPVPMGAPVLPGAGLVPMNGIMRTGFPAFALPALGAIGRAAVPAVIGAGRVAVGVGRGLLGAANRWCQRNPKTCASLGGAAVVADMMRSGEIKRPGRRINPMNVRAMRRAIRRVKAGRKIARQIESLLPHRTARAREVHAVPSRVFHARR